MKISIHIPFFNEKPEEKIKPLNKTKLFFLKKSLKSLQTLPCLLYTSPSPRDRQKSRIAASA